MRQLLFIMALAALLPGTLPGQEVRGSIFGETRLFPSSPAFDAQRDDHISPSFGLEPEFTWDASGGSLRISFTPFVRVDANDTRRTHVDVREASVLYLSDGWTLFAGVGKVFWGTTEANHLVDIINQTDAVEDIDAEDKLGQPMINFTLERDWGALDFFVLPYFRERTYPGSRGRLRGQFTVLDDEASYESNAGRWNPDLAVRWSFFTGDIDLAVSAFRGTGREPVLRPEQAGGQVRLRQRYDLIDQVSVDAQWTRGPTLWKVEAMTRGGNGDRFAAVTLGVEHTFFSFGPGAADLGVLAEWMVDGRNGRAPFTPFENDLFLGARWALNDTDDTSILGGPVIDYETGEMILFLEAERRVGDRWLAEIEARWFANTDEVAPVHALRRDDFATVRVSRFF